MPPVIRASVPDLVFDQLREAILSGRYGPGERLPTQRVLAAELDVNLASVRQAVARLEQLRLVEVRHGDAMRVLDWRSAGGLEALAALGATDVGIIGPLFEARRLLLVEAARLAAERRSDTQSERLCELASAFGEATDETGALACEWQFMSAVIEAADNIVFQLIMNSVRRLYLPNATAFARVVADRGELAPLYTATAGAIRTRDGAGAARALGELARAQEQRMVG